MPTKLSRYADGIMEAAWIAAIILTPLFFDKYSSRIFEPDKATLLRTLALVILGAWVVKVAEVGIAKRDPQKSWWQNFVLMLKEPIVPLVFALAVVYTLATIFSVTPRISFWGSYQRLQGFYTTSAYIVIFAALAANLRRQGQVERLMTAAILTSLPVSLYGVLQKYGIDPIPWGGNVTNRVASHMGNSIFVAAYLIMIFPLTVGRIVRSFGDILKAEKNLGRHIARSTIYIFIAALQLIAIYFSKSRGPLLGLLAGAFFIFILLALHWRLRWLVSAVILLGVLAGAFLITLNIPNGPLESIREEPWVGRLGKMLDTEQRTSRVRILIWGGAAEMVAPHDPLVYPDEHTDPFNFLRPLIGYGPETMHMAYNPFYPPDLAHAEKRNASPDRSHNETWDSLIITGGLGLLVYIGLFASAFYYGLKWLKLINTHKQKITFFALYFGGGIASAIGFYLWGGIAYFGVALPFGMIVGTIIYLTFSALFIKSEAETTFTSARSITLIVLLAAVMAHFVEINFGIAIVATRTHFFAYAALLLAVGKLLPERGAYLLETESAPTAPAAPSRKSRKSKKKQTTPSGKSIWTRPVAIGTLITGLLLIPLLFEYVSNLNGGMATLEILWLSLTRYDKNTLSYGVLALLLTTWVAASLLFASETPISDGRFTHVLKRFAVILLGSGAIALAYGLWLSNSLAWLVQHQPSTVEELMAQTASFEGLLTQFYIFLFLILLGLAAYLPVSYPKRTFQASSFGAILAPVMLIVVVGLSYFSNWRIIQADIAFKLAEPFSASQQFDIANLLYERSKMLAPDEDYYDLFLGRNLLELAKTKTDAAEKQAIFEKTEADLLEAQAKNPLNPDHTANLARLYSWWAMQTNDPAERQARGEVSDNYYRQVLILSPNNARLWDEWAILHLDVLRDDERGLELLDKSLEIDPEYDWTHMLLGNYYFNLARRSKDDPAKQDEYYQKAIEHYEIAIELAPRNLNYRLSLASVYQMQQNNEKLIEVLEDSLPFAKRKNDIWRIEQNIAQAAYNLGDIDKALEHAYKALAVAPESEAETVQQFIQQLEALKAQPAP